jgi:hypothetical protein
VCNFLSFLFLQRLQVVIDKPIASHESEEMMLEITNIVENGLTYVKSSSQRIVDKLKVNFEESMIEDQKINNFLTTMEETTNGGDLKDFSQVTSEEDEKEIVNMKNESSPSNQGQTIEILEDVEQVILLVFDKPIESKVMVVVKFLLTSLERIFKTYILNISKDFLVVFG